MLDLVMVIGNLNNGPKSLLSLSGHFLIGGGCDLGKTNPHSVETGKI